MIDLVSEMASAHTRFRTGALAIRVPSRPRVWRAPYLAPADVDRGRYWTLERAPLPVPSGRPIVPGERDGSYPAPLRENSAEMGALFALEWIGLLGPCRPQKVMACEIFGWPSSKVCTMIREALAMLGQDRTKRGFWDRVLDAKWKARRAAIMTQS